VTPTKARTLLLVALVAGLLTFLLARLRYDDLPPLPWSAAFTTFGLAVLELFLAPSIRARLEGRPRTKPIMPIAVARAAAFAKASSTLGALLGGAWLGLLGHLATRLELTIPRRDAIRSGIGLAAALLLVGAALRLEGVCRVPPPPPEAEPGP
jgi:VIT1/CCC1 family predicted Fe2+/Mn2+ transporter